MIAQEGHQAALVAYFQQLIDYTARIWSAVDGVAERDQRVTRCRLNGIDKRTERGRTSVDISNRNDSLGH
jgi:hypothetical protein